MTTHKHGFSLVEAAIVLGVIGLVIGGIWVAASSVSRNIRRNDIRTTVLDMQARIQTTWNNHAVFNGDNCGAFVDLTSTIYDSSRLLSITGAPPSYEGLGHALACNALPLPSGVYFAAGTNKGSSYLNYAISGLDRSDCIWVSMDLLTMFGKAGYNNFTVTNTGYYQIGFSTYIDTVQAQSTATQYCADQNNTVIVLMNKP